MLLIAPHPFYQERGTPIAVDMLLQVLSADDHRVDVCTFPEGEPRHYPGVVIHRAAPRGRVANVGPGFSLKKLYTDFYLFRLAGRLCRENRYDVVHAVEEAGFFGLYFKTRRGIPYVYDMDSVLSDQLIESRPWLAPLRGLLEKLENRVVRGACALAPMCQELADRAGVRGGAGVVVLKDVSLIRGDTPDGMGHEDLRKEFGITGPIAMYVGNLEPYQGIELMLRGFARALEVMDATLVVVGGKPEHIRTYRELAGRLDIGERVRLIGPRPVARLSQYLGQADVLISPRTRGSNTPMKIYSYLHSGVAVLATDLPTHTQVLDNDIAVLAAPEPGPFGRALVALLGDRALRARKGARASEYARREHGFRSFERSVRELYRTVADKCRHSSA